MKNDTESRISTNEEFANIYGASTLYSPLFHPISPLTSILLIHIKLPYRAFSLNMPYFYVRLNLLASLISYKWFSLERFQRQLRHLLS